MRKGTAFRIVSGTVVAASIAFTGWMGTAPLRQAQETSLSIAPVRKGEFVAIIRCRGQIKAGRAARVYAPRVPNLRIAWMAPPGEIVEQGEPVIRFDSSSAQQELIPKRAALEQAQATLDQAIVEGRITAQRDESDLADSRLNVELAKLKTANNEFVSRIEAEQSQIDLAVAEQNLRMLEAEVAQHVVSNESKVASLTRQRDHARADMELTIARLSQMEILAPLTGYAIYSTNRQSMQNPQPFRVGDSVSVGMNLAVIPDMTSLMIDVSVEETDRGRMTVGDNVRVRVDALPELVIEATLTRISPLAEFSFETFSRSFRAYAALDEHADPRLRPGMNGGMDIIIERIPDAITVPAQALFTRGGKPAVYLLEDGNFRAVDVQVLARNPDEVAIAGIPDDARVSLVDPLIQAGGEEGGESSE